ncbi:MAG: DUF1772 domain-containing protein [Actinomycetota bacterium]|nr:DUF1772 domain-containing protein [Actinomycetota bacterium]
MSALHDSVLIAATVATGLQAGTYYTWASGVMPGLARVDDRTFVHAMQQMNIAIVNPVFMATFLGAPILAAAAAATTSSSARPWVIAGLTCAVATVVITAVANVPLNNALDAAGDIDRTSDLAAVRAEFESSWVRWNIVRALTSTASLVALAWAALRA